MVMKSSLQVGHCSNLNLFVLYLNLVRPLIIKKQLQNHLNVNSGGGTQGGYSSKPHSIVERILVFKR